MTGPQGEGEGEETAGFLARWSARKRAEAGQLPEGDGPPAETPADPLPEPRADPESRADPDVIAALPRIEDIGPGTDIRGFLRAGVPRALRNAALRRAWVSNPAIATYEDPARDYFWDWNAPGGVPGGGGRLTVAEALRMADRVSQGPAPAPAADLPDGAAATAPGPGTPAEPQTPAAPDAPADGTAPGAAASPPPAAAPEPLADASTPPRRHGGAAPA